MKKAIKRKDSGVSEVVGSILTLSITVVLFATIFMSVNQMPMPTGHKYANFEIEASQVTLANNTTKTYLNITHKGGETLKGVDTVLYLISSNDPSTSTTYTLSISDGLGKNIWKPGEVWHKVIYGNIDMGSAYILVFDRSRSTIVWRGDLASGLSVPLPPIIMDRGTTPDPVSRSSNFRIYAYVKDPNLDFDPDSGKGSLTVDVSSMHLYSGGSPVSTVAFTHDIGYRYVTPELNVSTLTPDGSHLGEITAVDDAGNSAREIVRVIVEAPSTEECDIYIAEVDFSPQSPVTGQATQITVTFANAGDSYGYCVPHITDYPPVGDATNITTGGMVYISAHGESSRTYTWNNPHPAGNHNISVYAEVPGGSPTDSDMSNNNFTEPLSILPKILLVDDDHNKDFNTANFMKEALNATGYSYDVYTVAYDSDDGPQNSTLQKYDVVIWMTGKDITNSLTTRTSTGDVKNLEEFLDNGGKLWLIGEGLMDNANIQTFISSYLGASVVSNNVALPPILNGSAPALGDIYNISLSATGYGNGKYTDYIAPGSGSTEALYYNDSGTHRAVGVSHTTSSYATMLFSFEFSTIRYSSDRAQIAYEVLRWLSGIQGKTGRDVAIGGVTVDPDYPLYKDEVNITINIRNNGWNNESARVQLIIDGVDVTLSSTVVDVGKNGGMNTTYGIWSANTLGEHTLVARVDPYNEIAESDETNNVYVTSFIVRFRTLIVDDDDSSNNRGGLPGLDDWASSVENSFDNLLSSRALSSNYSGTADIWVVDSTASPPDGPAYENMSLYNAVIWITGSDSTNSFTSSDMNNIMEYINASGMLWVIGDGFLDDLADGVTDASPSKISTFMGKLGIGSYSLGGASGFGELTGTLNDEIGHGIDFSMNTGATAGADGMNPVAGGDGILSGNGEYVGIKYASGYKAVVFTFNPNATAGLANYYTEPHFTVPADIANRTTYELTYLVMHWFGQINTNPEMKVGADLYVNGEDIDRAHLVLGSPYILEAKVHNVGSEDILYATVRFYDGNHIIGAGSVGVSADNVSTVSVIWAPRYAGQSRPIRVIVDYYQEVQEIPNPANLSENLFEYNNEAVHYVPVYFFWDDMENGTGNWRHAANVVNINGENPIDFLGAGYNTVYTDVIYQWNETLSQGGVWTSDVFHSYNRSYWLKEPSPTGVPIDQVRSEPIPLDVVFALDTSGSMDGTKWHNAREATIQFIENLTARDRAAIWRFDPSGSADPSLMEPARFMTASNKSTFISDLQAIGDYDPTGGTPFYDTLGSAIDYVLSSQFTTDSGTYYLNGTQATDVNSSDNSRLEIVIGMTDGASNSDDEWTPECDWGDTTSNDPQNYAQYGDVSGFIGGAGKGLIKAPPMVFTIGLGVTHDDATPYPTAPNWSHEIYPNPTSYPREYDLWNCADKTPWPWGKYGRDFNQSNPYGGYSAMSEFNDPDPFIGHYYYTDDPNQLTDIFQEIRGIAQAISTGNGQAAGNGNVTRAADFQISSIGGSGTRGGASLPSPLVVETRYMRSDSQNVNGLNAYVLGTTQSSLSTRAYIGYGTAYAGIRVWKRSSSGAETEITPGYAVAVASTTSGGTIVSSTWTCPLTTLSTTDSIVVRVYAEDDDPTPDEVAAEFTTEQLGAVRLESSTWTVYYYLDGWGYDYFYWGDSSTNSRIEGFEYSLPPPSKPGVYETYPPDGSTALPSQYVAVVFNKSMDTSHTPSLTQNSGTTVTYTFEGWFTTYNTDDTAIWSHDNWTAGDTVSLTVSDYVESSGTYTGDPYTWSFNVYSFTSSGGGGGGGGETNTNKTAVTRSFDLSNVQSAVLTFWHKYSIVPGMNGAFIELGYRDGSGNWRWNYMIPAEGAYTGNMNLSATRTDSDGDPIVWAWNGVSGKGTFTWEFVKVDLMTWIPAGADKSEICVKFNYTQYGLGTGYGWYIDDVKVVVTRSDASAPVSADSDVWQIITTQDRNGDSTHAWWNGDPAGSYFKAGIDNSLISRPIDLTNAWTAHLSAYFKFNINTSSGAPPDGFRVEISKDSGVTWTAINLGVRSAWGVSGTDGSGNTTITGVNAGNYWVEAGTLTRLNVDLTAFRGNTIMIRFRVVTTNAATYQHYDQATGWGGFYLDDVVILGESLGA